jgi:predicted Zn-dependent protease
MEAIPAFRRALDLWPDDPLVQFNLAHALLDNGQRDEAVSLLRAVVSSDAWRDMPAHQKAALAARGMTPEEFRSRVQAWLAKNASP